MKRRDDKRFGQEYRKLSDSELNTIAEHFNEGIAHKPQQGISPEMIERIKYLEEKLDKDGFKPAETTKVLKVLEETMDDFTVHGVRRPKAEDKPRRLKALIMEMLEVFDECNIYPVKVD